jgi:hypothetical protein
MTEFENKLLSALDNIHKEMVIASLPEDYRKYQRELFNLVDSQKIWDKMTEDVEKELQEMMDEYIKQNPEYEGLSYDDTVRLKQDFIRLDKQAQKFAAESVKIDNRIEKLCKHYKCVHNV